MEAVLPVEIEIPSLKVLSQLKFSEAEWNQQRCEQLNMIDERRLRAICHGQAYQKRVAKSFNKKVKPRHFEVDDLVVKKLIPNNSDPRGIFTPNYEGSYIVKKILPGGALILIDKTRTELAYLVNTDAVKIFYS